jgi:hypothetical protein
VDDRKGDGAKIVRLKNVSRSELGATREPGELV